MGSPGLINRNNGKRLGITEPISLGGPTEDDVNKTRELEKVPFLLFLVNWICFVDIYYDPLLGLEFIAEKNIDELGFVGVQYLRDAGLYESQEEAVSREEVLGRLDQVQLISYLLPCYITLVV